MAFDNKRSVIPMRQGPKPSPFGHTTLRFLSEGEQREASQWQDVPAFVEDELQARRLRAGDFHRIPRQRGATVGLAIFSVLLGLGVLLGIGALARTGRRLDASASQRQGRAEWEQHILAPAIDAPASASAAVGPR